MADLIIRPSIRPLLFTYALCGLLALMVFAAGFDREDFSLEILYLIPFMGLLWTIGQHIALRYTVLTIVDGKLKFEEGMLAKSTRNLELSKIQDVRVDQSIINRIMGMGDLTLENAGETGRLSMKNIDSPQKVADRILELARKKNQEQK